MGGISVPEWGQGGLSEKVLGDGFGAPTLQKQILVNIQGFLVEPAFVY